MKIWIFAALALSATAASAHEADRLLPLKELRVNGKDIIVSPASLTVYTFDNDTGRESTCYDSCAKAWPAVLVDANTKVADPISTTVRKDGSIQLAFDGHPVYTFAGDKNPGDTKGDGLGGIWHSIQD